MSTTLNNEDYIICSFGPEYYRGVAWGSAMTLLGVLAFMKRSHRQGMLNVEKALKSQTSDKVQQKIDVLEKYGAPSGKNNNNVKNSRIEFQKEQIAKAKSMYDVDMYSWTMIRVGAIAATLKILKLFLSWRRYSGFMFEEEYAREMSQKILDDAMKNLVIEEEELKNMEMQAKSLVHFESEMTIEQKRAQKQQIEKRKQELQKVRDAIMIQALDDFRNVVQLEKEIVNFNKSKHQQQQQENEAKNNSSNDEKNTQKATPSVIVEDNSHLVVEMNDRLNIKTGYFSNAKVTKKDNSKNSNYDNNGGDPAYERAENSNNSRSNNAQNQVMPTFWDGFSVGVWGSLIDADVPQKRIQSYLGLRAGKEFW